MTGEFSFKKCACTVYAGLALVGSAASAFGHEDVCQPKRDLCELILPGMTDGKEPEPYHPARTSLFRAEATYTASMTGTYLWIPTKYQI
jgi:hypothetical protein